MYQANGKRKKAGIAQLISYQMYFKKKSIIIDKEENMHNDKRISSSERHNNIYTGPQQYMKQILTLLKGERENSIIDLHTSLSLIDCKTRPPKKSVKHARI